MGIRYAYDDRMNWPGVWYFREFPGGIYMGSTPTLQQMEQADIVLVGEANRSVVEPLLEDRYQRFDFKRMWWPMMDYFNLTPGRINNTFDLSATNTQASGIRRGLFDIWWSRDYTRYGQAVGKDFSVTNWPVGENMSMYVRRDFATKVWNYGTGLGVVDAGTSQQEISACVANWQDLSASIVFDTSTQLLLNPVGVSVHGDRVYVAEVGGHRISVFDRNGTFIESFGQRGTLDQIGAFFERPYSVDIADDGTLYVVDTWNYRIRSFSPDGEAQATWGSPLTVGINAPQEPVDGFWGPRDIALDPAGNVYVADTGNKRIRVYSPQGQWLRDIGAGGSAAGQLDEPSGLAIHPDGRLYIADTWNRRVSVFSTEGVYITNFPVRAWYEDLGNRPYIAIDAERDYLYVTDPDAGRVLVYTTAGECVGAFGRPNRDNPNSAQFNTVGGITLDSDGNVYVTDLATGRLLMFPPFPAPDAPEDPNMLDFGQDMNEDVLEMDPDADSGSGNEPAPETTEESAPQG
jgi:DNA-binding beta-propeller fold protein YncE